MRTVFQALTQRDDRLSELTQMILDQFISDLSAFHLVWFVQGREPLRQMFEPFTPVLLWCKRMSDFGHGDVEVIEGPVPRPAADGRPGQSVYFRDPDGNLLELLSSE